MPWLALGLTPGLGVTRARGLLEHSQSVAAVFRASLTELEAAWLLASSAHSIGTGKSLELAQEELTRVAAAGAQVVTLDDPAYPGRWKQIYDPPLVLYVRGEVGVLSQPGIGWSGRAIPRPTATGWRSGCRWTWRGGAS